MPKFLRQLFARTRSADAPSGPKTLTGPISGQGRIDESLRARAEHFAKLVSGVRDYAVFLLDRQGKIVTWNAGAERIKGYRAEEIVGQHFSRFYPADAISSGWPAHELEVASATGRFEDEGWRLRKDGSQFWASVVISAVRDDSGAVHGFLKITRDLTDRKQAEEKLRLSEERFRLLVEGVRDYAIFMLDPEGRVATWNTGAEGLKGYRAGEIIGQHFSRFYPQEAVDRGWPDEELRRAAAEGRFEDEGWRVRKDGSTFWANVVITALRDEAGVLQGFAKVTQDLTARRQAEESARRLLQEEAARKAAEDAAQEIDRQREQLHVTLTSIGDAVIVTDQQARVTFLNPVAVRLTGWELNEATGQTLEQIFRIINEESRQPVENPVEKVFRENRIVELANHTALVAKNGREIPIEDTAAPIRGKENAIVGAVLVFRDVTAARRAMETRQYLAAIVESSDDAIIGETLDGTIASWNKGAERLYGYRPDEIIGQPISRLFPPDDSSELLAIQDRVRAGESVDHLEVTRVCKDGRRVEVSLSVSPMRDAGGKIIGVSKIARDITARKEEERRKNEFLALLAHELRNPLAPLRNSLQIMQLAQHDPQTIEQARSVMERQLQHLVRLVDDLLDVSRIGQGKLHLRKERITMAEIVAHALEISKGLIEQQEDQLTVTLPDEPLEVEADKTRLCQALCNLLNNAAKYSDPGSCIWLTVERQGDEAVISVKDTGMGIPPQMLPTIFQLFTQVDRSLEKSQGGLGVGLAIVKSLIEMHGGTVEARSEGPGQGSEFIVRLPVWDAKTPERQVPGETSQAEAAAGRRILVVDDNVDAASSLALMLRLIGNDVQTAHDGEAGFEAAAAFRPDVILLDLGMPRLNGFDTARRIRSEPWGKQVSLVALTGWGHEDDRRKSQESGFDFHLVKPVEPAALQRLLADLSVRSD